MNPFTESTVARPLSEPAAAAPAAGPRPTDTRANTSLAGPATGPVSPEPYVDSESAASWDTACVADTPDSIRTASDSSVQLRSCPLIQADRRPGNAAICPLRRKGATTFHSFAPLVHRKKRSSFLAAALNALGLAASLSFGLPAAAAAVDVNAATQAQLEAVRGIGPKTAEIIIQERMRGGQYESFEDLSDRVKGIGPKKAASLQAAGLTLGLSAGSANGTGNTASPLALLPVPSASQGPASAIRRPQSGKTAGASRVSPASKSRP